MGETKTEDRPLCGLSEAQYDALNAPLRKEFVSLRENKFSYIQAHHAIREMNRIFGPAGWTRETIEMKCVHDSEFAGNKGSGFRAAYIAKVRVTVRTEDGWVVREGTGYGDAVDYNNPAAVHEGASKEAESDSMKRACMTFGDPLGLALYSRDQEHVDDSPPAPAPPAPAPEPPALPELDEDGYPVDRKGLAHYMQEVLGIPKDNLGPMRTEGANRAWGAPPEDWKTLAAAKWGELARAIETVVNEENAHLDPEKGE